MSRLPPVHLVDRDGDIAMTTADDPSDNVPTGHQPSHRPSGFFLPAEHPYWRRFVLDTRVRSPALGEDPLQQPPSGTRRPLVAPSNSYSPQPFPPNPPTNSFMHLRTLPSPFRADVVDAPRTSDLDINHNSTRSVFDHDLKQLSRLSSAVPMASDPQRASPLTSSTSAMLGPLSSLLPSSQTPPQAHASQRGGHLSESASREGSASPPFPLRTRDSLELIEQGFLQPHHRPADPLKPSSPSFPKSQDNATEEMMDSTSPPRWLNWGPSLIESVLPPIQTDPTYWPQRNPRQDPPPLAQQLQPQPQPQTPRPRHRRRMSRPPVPRIPCTACMEEFKLDDLLNLACACRYCTPCLNAAFRAGCTNMASFPPKCCGRPLRISVWGSLLEADILARYKAIEAEFSANRPLYCARSTCSAFLAEEVHILSEEVGVCPQCCESTCQRCRRLMVDHPVWSVESRVCPAEDANLSALYTLGSEKKWKQCPTCLNMVERIEGCNHMDCVCGVEFCYRCGKLFDEDDSCDCDPNSLDEDEDGDDDEDDEDDDDDGEHDDDADEEEWPNFRAAVDALGRPSCLHRHTEALGGANGFACHGCLQVNLLWSCNDCGLELCERCLDRAQRRALGRMTGDGDSEESDVTTDFEVDEEDEETAGGGAEAGAAGAGAGAGDDQII